MGQPVIHHAQVAWDAARAFVRAAGGPDHDAFSARVLSRLGAEMYGELANTRQRLLAASLESGFPPLESGSSPLESSSSPLESGSSPLESGSSPLESGDRGRRTADVEAGKWRARLEDLLRGRPDLATALRELTGSVS
ncbi:hypothetical protein [Couchioplanes azureus]|uniref:hypothetical protein n=1 Tax=Couchioplanes caeruleus TaxID=56438 RepID=UPI001670C066|nr:hypothetical protein [Couchioplanes caeruleus]GGQ79333.1 hypothetical protein GCM10010166_56610 [Couchioplanes caeruleus subsp. azureus]